MTLYLWQLVHNSDSLAPIFTFSSRMLAHPSTFGAIVPVLFDDGSVCGYLARCINDCERPILKDWTLGVLFAGEDAAISQQYA